MTFPRKVQVGPKTYTVTTDSVEVDKQDAEGVCLAKYEKIFLHPDLPAGTERVAMLHEIFHACFDDHTVGGPFEKVELEELACSALAPRFLDVLRRNPRLVAYLTAH